MTKAFQVELKKARHRHDLLLCLLVPVLMIIWVGGLSPSSPEELANGYSALFYSVPCYQYDHFARHDVIAVQPVVGYGG